MATIASLNIYLNANSNGFSKGVEAATRETVRFMMGLDMQARTLGMSAEQAKLYQLEMRGVEKSLVDTARQTLETVNALKSQQAATESARALAEELRIQGETFRMTADEAKIYRLEMAGASSEAVQAARDHAAFIQFLREEKAALDGATAAANRNATAAGKVAAGGGLLGSLKRTLGGRSSLKDVLEIARGGGAVIGLTMAARALGNAAAEAAKLREELENGSISAGEMVDRIGSGIPLIGEFWKAGRAIRELITQEDAEARRELEQAEKMKQILEERIKQVDEEKKRQTETRRQFGVMLGIVKNVAAETGKDLWKNVRDGAVATTQNVIRMAEAFDQLGDARDAAAAKAYFEAFDFQKILMDQYTTLAQGRVKQLQALMGSIPKTLQFAAPGSGSARDAGVGEALRRAMQSDYGLSRAAGRDRLQKEANDILRQIARNTGKATTETGGVVSLLN